MQQDDVIEKLSDALYEQQQAVAALEQRLASLEKRAAAASDEQPTLDPQAERPPHY